MTIEVIGHRGARGMSPELTLQGFSKALDIGVDSIELDVGISADRVAMAYHDYRLNPDITRDRHGQWITAPGPRLRDLTSDELRSFDVGRIRPDSAYARQFAGQVPSDCARIPRLRDVVALLRARNFGGTVYIEAKSCAEHPGLTIGREEFAETLAGEIRELDIADSAVVESFDWAVLNRIRILDPQIAIAPITSMQPGIDNIGPCAGGLWTGGPILTDSSHSIAQLAQACGGEAWCSDHRDLTRWQVQEAERENLKVIAWTVNRPHDISRMISIGVSGIVTDYPDRVLRALNREIPGRRS